jgi:hypothetical protein
VSCLDARGAFIGGDLDMPEADWVARELVSRAGIVVVSVDYRLCVNGVTYPVPHDDVVAAMRWVRQNARSRRASSMMSARVRDTALCAWSTVSCMVSSFRFGGGMGSRPRRGHSRLGGPLS